MDGLSMLLGILVLIFLVLMFGMNFLNATTAKEGFQDSPSSQVSEIETLIRSAIDSLAFYNSPGGVAFGSGNTDGEQLCTIFTKIRTTMAQQIIGEKKNDDLLQMQKEGKANGLTDTQLYENSKTMYGTMTSLNDAEVAKQVETLLSSSLFVPGGALPCPFLKYPAPGSSDIQWLAFLSDFPDDFGARVVLMANYASRLSNQSGEDNANDFNDKLSTKTSDLSYASLSESFVDICTADIALKKRADQVAQLCTLPENINPEDIKSIVANKLLKLLTTKTSVLNNNNIDPEINIHSYIVSGLAKINELEGKINVVKTLTG